MIAVVRLHGGVAIDEVVLAIQLLQEFRRIDAVGKRHRLIARETGQQRRPQQQRAKCIRTTSEAFVGKVGEQRLVGRMVKFIDIQFADVPLVIQQQHETGSPSIGVLVQQIGHRRRVDCQRARLAQRQAQLGAFYMRHRALSLPTQ